MGVQTRFVVLDGEFGRFLLAAGQNRAERENDRSTGVPNVPLGPLHVVRRWRLDQWIPFGNTTVLGFPPFRTPAAAFEPLDNAQSRAARSGSVWPPETILGMCVLIRQLYKVVETFSRIWCRDWPLEMGLIC
jgi:hypothetical protein